MKRATKEEEIKALENAIKHLNNALRELAQIKEYDRYGKRIAGAEVRITNAKAEYSIRLADVLEATE